MGAAGMNYNYRNEASSWTPSEIARQIAEEYAGYGGETDLGCSYREYADLEGTMWATPAIASASDARILREREDAEYEAIFTAEADRMDAALAAVVSDPRWVAAQVMNDLARDGKAWLRMDLAIDRTVLAGMVKAGLVYSRRAEGFIRDVYPTAKARRWIASKADAAGRRMTALEVMGEEEPWDVAAERRSIY